MSTDFNLTSSLIVQLSHEREMHVDDLNWQKRRNSRSDYSNERRQRHQIGRLISASALNPDPSHVLRFVLPVSVDTV
jgi:hypothetical protein